MQPNERGVPVSQAAAILGISVAAARKRVQRGSLRSYKVDGQWMVVLPSLTPLSQDVGMTVDVGHGYDAGRDQAIDDLRDRVRFLEGLVNELMRRVPELPAGPNPLAPFPQGKGMADNPSPQGEDLTPRPSPTRGVEEPAPERIRRRWLWWLRGP